MARTLAFTSHVGAAAVHRPVSCRHAANAAPSATQPHRPRRGLAVQAAPSSAPVVFSDAVEERRHALPDGLLLELLHLPPATTSAAPSHRPPLLFVHGSYHAAWCFRERFLPYFSAAGYDCWAVSLRAQGGSERGSLKVAGTLQSHADDLASVVAALPAAPVVVAHSFGGLLLTKYATQLGQAGRPALAGVALISSVPPTGNGAIVARITKNSLLDALKITWAFVGKSFARSAAAARETFFSPDIGEEDLARYQAQLAACSPVRLLDLGSLKAELPLPPLPAAAAGLPAFVGGGASDLVVDVPAVEEAAAFFGVAPVVWPRTAHDCMLDTRWEAAAASLRAWLDTLPPR